MTREKRLEQKSGRFSLDILLMGIAVGFLTACLVSTTACGAEPDVFRAKVPYPPSAVIESITWHWETRQTAALGSDLWPVTWGVDGSLYAAWGDGGGFGGSDEDGRVSMGFARIDGPPESFVGTNVNGGKNPEHPASFPHSGKTGGILSVSGVIYAWMNMQNGRWPDVDMSLIWSDDQGATWKSAPWIFPRGPGNFRPGTFLNFGRDYTGVPRDLQGYVYFYGIRQGDDSQTFMGRAPLDKIRDRSAYQFLRGLDASNQPAWGKGTDQLYPIFKDPPSGGGGMVAYIPALRRYLLSTFHDGPGQLGIFDGPKPWGPWTSVAYYEDWGKMGTDGEGLTCDFPEKWMSADGLKLWCVFSAYGKGARQGINAHDRFNLVQATLALRQREVP